MESYYRHVVNVTPWQHTKRLLKKINEEVAPAFRRSSFYGPSVSLSAVNSPGGKPTMRDIMIKNAAVCILEKIYKKDGLPFIWVELEPIADLTVLEDAVDLINKAVLQGAITAVAHTSFA